MDSETLKLCVPFERRNEAAQAGAYFDGTLKAWLCRASDKAKPGLVAFLPYRHRSDRNPPYLRPWMVPQSLWGMNLRALLIEEDWKRVAKDARDRSGCRCRVCGEVGPQWPVEADEGWAYDDQRRIQTLKGVIALCPDCHAVRHWGRTLTLGDSERALAWMARVNRTTVDEAKQCCDDAMEQWQQRSRYSDWRCEISWVTRVYNITPRADGEREARARNTNFVSDARQRAQANTSMSHGARILNHYLRG